MSNLNLSAILAVATVYGEKLYDFSQAVSQGSTPAGTYKLGEDGKSIQLFLEGNSGPCIYVQLTREAIENGIDESQPIEIIQVSALRDASGEFEGKAWSVKEGEVKNFARQ